MRRPSSRRRRARAGVALLTTPLRVTTFAHAQAARNGRGATAPDLVLTGGKVFTADPNHPWAQAIAIRADRIVAVGTDADVRRLAQRATREIPLGGRVVIPGINDAHDHLGDAPIGVSIATSASPTPDPTSRQVLDSIRAVAARTPARTWIKVTVGERVMADTALRRIALDRVSSGHPVFLWAFWGHGMVLNSAGLHALGISDTASDPLGGWYDRDPSGRLTW
jgi:predicted amidohydrolase YtcJ